MESTESPSDRAAGRIAVIGIGLRLPQQDAITDFWQLLIEGRDIFQPVPSERWEHRRYHPADTPFCQTGGFLDQIHAFDPSAFGLTAQDVAAMETRQRMMLEATDRALRDGGVYVPATGVYVSCGENPHNARSFLDDIRRDDVNMRGMLENATNNMVAARLSKAYGFESGSFVVQAACASSLVAIAQACDALRLNHCDVAIAGGVEITHSPTLYALFGPNRVLSPSGQCRPYTEVADGFVPGEGAAAVVLKRYEDAQRDGDHMYALVAGHGISNDGRSFSAMAPNPAGQSSAARQALTRSGVTASSIEMLEGHGTATKIGDAVEISAMQSVYKDGRQALTSVKSNLGHCFAAAGVVSFCKTALSLYFDTIPGIAHFDQVDPRHRIKTQGPYPIGEAVSFKEATRRAAINSLGIGGTNCHMILESAPKPPEGVDAPPSSLSCVEFSGRTPAHLQSEMDSLEVALSQELKDVTLSQLTPNLARRARLYPQHRLTLVARDLDELKARLQERPKPPEKLRGKPKVIFVCPGPGSFCNRALQALRESPEASKILETCNEVTQASMGLSLDELGQRAAQDIASAQPVVFALSLASAAWLSSLGLSPHGLVGHSAGEYAALVLAGSTDLKTALNALIARGNAMASTPPGRMAALLTKDAQPPSLPTGVEIAAYNASDQWVVSGAPSQIETLIASAESGGFIAKPLAIPCAAHSGLMESAQPILSDALKDVTLSRPQRPWFSTVFGKELKVIDREYLVEQLRVPVRFSDAIKAALDESYAYFVELGGSAILSSVIQKIAQEHGKTAQTIAVHRFGQGQSGMDDALQSLLNHGLIKHQAAPSPLTHKLFLQPPSYHRASFPIAFAEEQADRVSQEQQSRFQPGEQAPIRASDYQLFDDHKVNGRAIAPAAWMLDKLIGHSRSLPFTLEGMTITAPLESRTSKFWRKRQGSDSYHFETSNNGEDWLPHLSARPSHNHVSAPDQTTNSPGESLGTDVIYRALADGGLTYGESLKTIQSVSCSDDHLRAELHSRTNAPFAMVDPSILDGAFQALVSFLISSDDRRPMLGFAAKRITLLRDLRDRAVVDIHVKLRHPEMIRVDLSLKSMRGEPILIIEDFTARRVKEDPITVGAIDWVPLEKSSDNLQPRRIGILGQSHTTLVLASKLIKSGHQVFGPAEVQREHGELVLSQSSMVLLVEPTIEDVYYLSSRLEKVSWLGVLTSQAPVAAMIRSLAAEESLRAQIFLTSPGQDISAVDGFLEASRDMLRFDGIWRRPKLRKVHLERSPILQYRSAWIIGGTGGIGASLAEALAKLKVRVTLSGRKASPPQAVAALVSDYPDQIDYLRADVSKRESLETAYLQMCDQDNQPDLVVHAAGLIRDGRLSSQSSNLIPEILEPKREGTQNLEAILDPKLKTRILLIGSLSAWVPSPGQALYSASNRFLSEAAQSWAHSNHQVSTLSFGPWKSVGMVADPKLLAKLAATGLDALSTEEGVGMILRSIHSTERELIIAKLRVAPEKLEEALSSELKPPRSPQPQSSAQTPTATSLPDNEVLPPTSSTSTSTSTPSSQLEQVLMDLFGAKTVQDEATTPFSELGIDSLKGVELTRRLESALGLKLAPTLLFEAPTLESLRRELETVLLERASQPTRRDRAPEEPSVPSSPVASVIASPIQSTRRDDSQAALTSVIREALGPLANQLEDDTPFADVGVDSLAGVDIVRKLESLLGQSLPPTLLFEAPNIRMLLQALGSQLNASPLPSGSRASTNDVPKDHGLAIPPVLSPQAPTSQDVAQETAKTEPRGARPFFVKPPSETAPSPSQPATTAGHTIAARQSKALDIIARLNEMKPNLRLEMDTPFADAGIDSLAGVEIVRSLENHFGQPLEPTLLFEHPTPKLLVNHLQKLGLTSPKDETLKTTSPSFAKEPSTESADCRAWHVSQARDGLAFSLERIDLAPLKPNEVEIETAYSGINFIDLLGRVNLHPALKKLPFTMGHEVGGRIIRTGTEVSGFQAGEHVVALIPQGGYATKIHVPSHQLISIPKTIPLEKATALLITGLTALVAIEEVGRVGEGDDVLIQASAGATGLACAQLALTRGAKVYGTASSPEKRDYLMSLGIEALDYSELKTKLKTESLDLIVDSLAGEKIGELLSLLRHGGRFVEIGAGAAIPSMKLDPAQLFLKHQSFSGVNVSELMKDSRRAPRLVRRWLNALESGELQLAQVTTFDFERATEAHELLQQRKTIGKLLLVNHVA